MTLCLAVSCSLKPLGEYGSHAKYPKDLRLIINWDNQINAIAEDKQTNYESARDFFMSTSIRQLDEHVMPVGKDYHIDTLVDIMSPRWQELRSDIYKETFFPARTYNHEHFSGSYDIFVSTLSNYDIERFVDTTDMSSSIPTCFELETTPFESKATAMPKYVPKFNELPSGKLQRKMERFYYGSKKGVNVLPGANEHEVHEEEIEMKTLKDYFLSIFFDSSIRLENFPGQAVNDHWRGFMVMGATGNYDLLNDKAIDPHNELRFNNEFFGTNLPNFPNAADIPTFDVSEETGKVEACIFGCVSTFGNNGEETFYWYKKQDITDEVHSGWLTDDRVVQLFLFEGGAVLPAGMTPSPESEVIWNEIK